MSTTVLDVVQGVLSKIDSDEVNSIGDTTEALQVADMVRDTYLWIVEEFDLQAVKTLFSLEATIDTPVVMHVPEGYHSIEWIKYDINTDETREDYEIIGALTPEVFTDHVEQFDTSATNVITVEVSNGLTLPAYNDRMPRYWTSFNGNEIVFDAYDSNIDSHLRSSKTNCYGQREPTLVLDDSTPIDLPPRFITMLKVETLAMAQDVWKNGVTPKVEQRAQRSRARAQRLRSVDRRLTHPDLPDYGRKRSY